jgi:nucleoside-triphosphatase THEP1
VESRKLLIGTVHWRVKNGLIQEMRSREDAEVYTVTYENRGELHKKIIRKGVEYLGKTEN